MWFLSYSVFILFFRTLQRAQCFLRVFKDKCLSCYCFAFSNLTLLPLVFIIALCSTYNLSINKHEDILSPVDIEYTSWPLLRWNITIIITLVLLWIMSFFSRRKTCLKIIIVASYICLYFAWLIVSTLSASYFAHIKLNSSVISTSMKLSMKDYKNNSNISLSWDKMQNLFQCCGTDNYTEWPMINKQGQTQRRGESRKRDLPRPVTSQPSIFRRHKSLESPISQGADHYNINSPTFLSIKENAYRCIDVSPFEWYQGFPFSCFEFGSSSPFHVACLDEFLNHVHKQIKAKSLPGLAVSVLNIMFSTLVITCILREALKRLRCRTKKERIHMSDL